MRKTKAVWILVFILTISSAIALENFKKNDEVKITITLFNNTGTTLVPIETRSCNISSYLYSNLSYVFKNQEMTNNTGGIHNYTFIPTIEGEYGLDVVCIYGGEMATFNRKIEVTNETLSNQINTINSSMNIISTTANAINSTVNSINNSVANMQNNFTQMYDFFNCTKQSSEICTLLLQMNTKELCGEKQGDKTHCIHHIDYDKKNSNPNNLITLCRKCHNITNHNRNYWEKYFNGLITGCI